MLIEFDLLIRWQGCFAKKLNLQRLGFTDGVQDRPRGNALVNMQGDQVYLERRVLGLAGPDELRVQVWVVGIASALALPHFVSRRHARRRIVLPPCLVVAVISDMPCVVSATFPHRACPGSLHHWLPESAVAIKDSFAFLLPYCSIVTKNISTQSQQILEFIAS